MSACTASFLMLLLEFTKNPCTLPYIATCFGMDVRGTATLHRSHSQYAIRCAKGKWAMHALPCATVCDAMLCWLIKYDTAQQWQLFVLFCQLSAISTRHLSPHTSWTLRRAYKHVVYYIYIYTRKCVLHTVGGQDQDRSATLKHGD